MLLREGFMGQSHISSCAANPLTFIETNNRYDPDGMRYGIELDPKIPTARTLSNVRHRVFELEPLHAIQALQTPTSIRVPSRWWIYDRLQRLASI